MAVKKIIKRVVEIPIKFYIEASTEELADEAEARCKREAWLDTFSVGVGGSYRIESEAART
jgi:hypothetical protein